MYSHVARAALRRAMVSPRANSSAARPRTAQVVVYPMMTVTIRHVSTGKDSPVRPHHPPFRAVSPLDLTVRPGHHNACRGRA